MSCHNFITKAAWRLGYQCGSAIGLMAHRLPAGRVVNENADDDDKAFVVHFGLFESYSRPH